MCYTVNLPYRHIRHCLQIPCHRHIQDDINRDRLDIVSLVLIPYLSNILCCMALELWACKTCVEEGKEFRKKHKIPPY